MPCQNWLEMQQALNFISRTWGHKLDGQLYVCFCPINFFQSLQFPYTLKVFLTEYAGPLFIYLIFYMRPTFIYSGFSRFQLAKYDRAVQ